MNLKDYYTEKETESIIGLSPKSRRIYLEAVKIYNRWWYPRAVVQSIALAQSHFDGNDPYKSLDLEVSEWTHLSGTPAYWPYSRERLYQLTIRASEPKIKFTKMNGQTLFNISSLKAYINAK